MLFSKINFLFFEKFQTFPIFFTPDVYPHAAARLGRALGPSRRARPGGRRSVTPAVYPHAATRLGRALGPSRRGAARASRRPARRACSAVAASTPGRDGRASVGDSSRLPARCHSARPGARAVSPRSSACEPPAGEAGLLGRRRGPARPRREVVGR